MGSLSKPFQNFKQQRKKTSIQTHTDLITSEHIAYKFSGGGRGGGEKEEEEEEEKKQQMQNCRKCVLWYIY